LADEEKVILSADASQFVKGFQDAAKAADSLSSLVGKTDAELSGLEKVAQRSGSALRKLSGEFKDVTTNTSAGASGFQKYAAAAADATRQINALESAQNKISTRSLSEVTVPSESSLGRNSAGQFSRASVSNLSDGELASIQQAYKLQRETLESVVAEEVKRREATQKSVAEAEKLLQVEKEIQAAAAQKTTADQDKNYADYLSQQERAIGGVATANKLLADRQDGAFKSLVQYGSYSKTVNADLANQRYALYDVATTYGVISAALLGASAAVVTTGASFETAFTNVERTSTGTAEQIGEVRDSLVDLSTTIPIAFGELSSIATLGNQIGVAQDQLIGFTETVGQFSAVSGISVETSAEAFGRLNELLPDVNGNFEALGSAIEKAGLNAAATDAQIISTAQQISSYTSLAGMGAAETVGLATAFASLGVAPEAARSAVSTFFKEVNSASANGGEALDRFASFLGTTQEGFQQLLRDDPSALIESFAASLGTLNAEEATQTLEALGLEEQRVSAAFLKLSGSTGVLTQANVDAAIGFEQGTELARQFGFVADDLNSRFIVLQSSIAAFADSISAGMLPGVSEAVLVATEFVNQLRALAETPAGQVITTVAFAVTTLVGAMIALQAAQALATASTFALTQAQIGLSAAGGRAGVLGLIAQLIPGLVSYKAGADGATVATYSLRAAFAALARATVILAVLGVAAEYIFNFHEAMAFTQDVIANLIPFLGAFAGGVAFVAEALVNVANIAADANRFIAGIASSLGIFTGILDAAYGALTGTSQALGGLASGARLVGDNVDATQKIFRDMANVEREFSKATDGVTDSTSGAAPEIINMGGAAQSAGKDADDASKGVDKLSKSVRTLKDYASDVTGVLDRVFEIEFGPEAARDAVSKILKDIRKDFDTTANDLEGSLDAIGSAWIDLEETQEAERQKVKDLSDSLVDYQTKVNSLRADLATLAADRSIQEYFLSVANAFGDDLRAGEITANIGEIDAKAAEKIQQIAEANDKAAKSAADLAQAQADASVGTEGNSKTAIKNRSTLRNLVGNYNTYIAGLVDAGESTEAVAAATEQSRKEYIEQATAMGFTVSEATKYADSIGDVSTVIDGNSTAALTNRGRLRDLNGAVADYAGALIAAGTPIGDVTGKIEGLTGKIDTQLGKFGFAATDVDKYSFSVRTLRDVLATVKPDLTVKFSKDAATTAINEYIAKLEEADRKAASVGGKTYTSPTFTDKYYLKKIAEIDPSDVGITRKALDIKNPDGLILRGTGLYEQVAYAEGGYTGPGGKYQEAGIVHAGEFVMDAKATAGNVSQLYALQSALRNGRRFDSGGFVGSSASGSTFGMGIVELGPKSMSVLREAVGRELAVYLGDREIADAANRGNAQQNSRGAF